MTMHSYDLRSDQPGRAAVMLRHVCDAALGLALVAVVVMLLGTLALGAQWLSGGRPSGDELLFSGIKGRAPGWVNDALAGGASVHARDRYDMTPLMWAAEGGDEELVGRLIRAGADISARSNYGMTPLAAAAGSGHEGVVKILLDSGADVNQPAVLDGTALHFAAGLSQPRTADVLIRRGANVNARNCLGETPLIVATSPQDEGALATIRHLLNAGADIDAADHRGRTALIEGGARGQP